MLFSVFAQVKKNREKRMKEKESKLEQLRMKKDAQFKARHLLQKVNFRHRHPCYMHVVHLCR